MTETLHSPPVPPVARKTPRRIEQLGRVRTDDYAWMKDENWQAVMRDPAALRKDVQEHLDAENAYTRAMLADKAALRDALFAEMKGRLKEDDSSVPAPDGPWAYYVRFNKGAQHPVYARRPRDAGGEAQGGEQVLLDVDALAVAHPYFDVGGTAHTSDHRLFAWAEDAQGSEYYRIRVKDLESGETLDPAVESSTGDFCFSPDGEWLFWTFRDENGRPSKIFRRPVRGGEDALVYAEPDDGFFLSVGTTTSERFVVVSAGNQETSEVLLIPAEEPTLAPRVVEPRRPGVRYDLDHWGDRFVIRTNDDGAVDFKLCFADEAHPGKASWRDWIPHQAGRFIVGVHCVRDWCVRLERVNANNRLVVAAKADLSEHAVAFDEDAYALDLDPGYEWETDVARFVYQSPTTPRQTFDYDLRTRERTLLKTQEVPSGHDASAYETRRLYATAPDGAEVPITVLMKAGTPLDGSAPLLLYGYGSYGIAMEPGFNTNRLSLVDRGWIWAIAHVRGGSEKGWGWFLDGRRETKTNTFTDFVACAETLTAQGYGRAGGIVCYGGSAGGLLVGAAINLRPDLFAGAVGAVPFVDVLNTMSDASLPLTPPEWPEWGNPLEDPEAYDRIAGYSPYDQVTAKAYPAVLATGGLSDPRVTYWEPAKWVAKLREHTTSDRPILLKMNMDAGHGGASGRWDALKEVAFDYAFAIKAHEGWTRPQG